MTGQILHQGVHIAALPFRYAGRTNVFEAGTRVPQVSKDYEVLRLVVTASQESTVNFGCHERTFKLTP